MGLPRDHQFGVFKDDERGPLWHGFFTDLQEAKKHAQNLAEEHRSEFFVYNFKDFSEIARFFPPRFRPKASSK
jgi:hypothetical protein